MSSKIGSHRRRRIKRALLERDGETCPICGRWMHPENRTIDHIQPRSLGGPNAQVNLRLTHLRCNQRRGNYYNPLLRTEHCGSQRT